MVKTRSKARADEEYQRDYLFAKPSDDEVKEHQKEFQSTKPIKLRRKRKLGVP